MAKNGRKTIIHALATPKTLRPSPFSGCMWSQKKKNWKKNEKRRRSSEVEVFGDDNKIPFKFDDKFWPLVACQGLWGLSLQVKCLGFPAAFLLPFPIFFSSKLWSQLRWAHIAIDKQLRGVANALPKLGQNSSPTVFDIYPGGIYLLLIKMCENLAAKIWLSHLRHFLNGKRISILMEFGRIF